MMDDDLVEVRMYDTTGIVTSMNSCNLSLALLFTQKAMTGAVNDTLPDLDTSIENLNEQIRDLSSLSHTSLILLLERKKTALYEAAASLKAAMAYLDGVTWIKGEGEMKKRNQEFIAEVLVNWRQRLRENTNICQMSIANQVTNNRRNYNIEVAEGCERAHYRVATERYGTVLHYAPPLKQHSYARWYDLFVPQYEVARRKRAEIKANGVENFFLKEDKELIRRLAKDNLSGFQLFTFDIQYGSQKTGGCWCFRKKYYLLPLYSTSIADPEFHAIDAQINKNNTTT